MSIIKGWAAKTMNEMTIFFDHFYQKNYFKLVVNKGDRVDDLLLGNGQALDNPEE